MPIELFEKWDSGAGADGDSPSREKTYSVVGTDDPEDALAALKEGTPVSIAGLPRTNVRVERFAEHEWLGTVSYAKANKPAGADKLPYPETGDSTYQLEIRANSQHISQSLETLGNYAEDGETPPDFKGVIGVTRDGVEGVDVLMPQASFSETHYAPDSMLDAEYRRTLHKLVGRVNAQEFRGYEPGEVLFVGARGSKRSTADWELTYEFLVSLNDDDVTVGDVYGVNKPGWAYLWIRHAEVEDSSAHTIVQKPTSVHVEKVYKDGDFSELRLDEFGAVDPPEEP